MIGNRPCFRDDAGMRGEVNALVAMQVEQQPGSFSTTHACCGVGERVDIHLAFEVISIVVPVEPGRPIALTGPTEAVLCRIEHSSHYSLSRRGVVAPNLLTLIAICVALKDAGCSSASFPELLRSDSPIEVNESLLLSSAHLINLLSGRTTGKIATDLSPESLTAHIDAAFEAAVVPVSTDISGATEERTRKALGINSTELADLSEALWRRTFSEERDHRAGAGANAQKRGQVTRQMRAELEEAIEATSKHGDDK